MQSPPAKRIPDVDQAKPEDERISIDDFLNRTKEWEKDDDVGDEMDFEDNFAG